MRKLSDGWRCWSPVLGGGGRAGGDANAQLFEALQAQDPETALYALTQGADAKAREADGTTPLHYAAHYRRCAPGRRRC